MSETFFTSDTHWGHSNIIKYSKRPYKDVEEMNEMMLQEWNKIVKPQDVIYHMGDVSFMPFPKLKNYLYRMNGTIHVTLGNHDKDITRNQSELLRQGKIASITHYRELNMGGEFIVLFHYGQRVWNKSHRGSIHLYGHSHGSLPPHGKSVDVGVDCKEITHEYRPIHLDEVIRYMSKRESEVVDHHGE